MPCLAVLSFDVLGPDNIMFAVDYPYQESMEAARFMNSGATACKRTSRRSPTGTPRSYFTSLQRSALDIIARRGPLMEFRYAKRDAPQRTTLGLPSKA